MTVNAASRLRSLEDRSAALGSRRCKLPGMHSVPKSAVLPYASGVGGLSRRLLNKCTYGDMRMNKHTYIDTYVCTSVHIHVCMRAHVFAAGAFVHWTASRCLCPRIFWEGHLMAVVQYVGSLGLRGIGLPGVTWTREAALLRCASLLEHDIYIYTYVYTHRDIHIHTYVPIPIYIYIYVHMYVYVCAYAYT